MDTAASRIAASGSKDGSGQPRRYRCSRRRLIASAIAGLPLVAAIGPAQSTYAASRASKSAAAPEGTYTGDKFGLVVDWDPDLWQVKFESRPGMDGIALVDSYVDLNDPSADAYFLQVEYQTRHRWKTVEDMAKNSMFEWFSDGMHGATVIEQWDTDDAHSWFHTFEEKNRQSLNYIEYSAVDAPNSVWRYIAITIDSSIFDADETASLFADISVDDGPIPWAVDMNELIDLFDEYVE